MAVVWELCADVRCWLPFADAQAVRKRGATYFGLVLSVVSLTNARMACLAAPSFHEGRISLGERDLRAAAEAGTDDDHVVVESAYVAAPRPHAQRPICVIEG